MRSVVRLLCWLGGAFGLLGVLLLAFFGLLQTQIGQAWLERAVAQVASGPDFSIGVEGLGGIVPFRMTAERVTIGDETGTWLVLSGVNLSLEVSSAALLARRLHIRSASIGEVDVARWPSSGSSSPLSETLKPPLLPFAMVLDRLAIDRLILAPRVLGEGVVAMATGSAEVAGKMARVSLDLHRTDGSPGALALATEITGPTPILNLQFEASELTGILLDRLFRRADHVALGLSLTGAGPLADWHGRLTVAAGALAHLDADLTLAVGAETELALSGTATVASLLPAEIGSLFRDRVALGLHARLADRTLLDKLSIETAAGTLTGDAAFGGSGDAVAAHLHANVPDLSLLTRLLGEPLQGSAVANATVSGTWSRPAMEAKVTASGFRLSALGAKFVAAEISATPTADLGNPDAPIDLQASGRIEGVVLPDEVVLSPELGRRIDWSLAAIAAADAETVELARVSANWGGLDLSGTGRVAGGGRTVEGRLSVVTADLRPLSSLAGRAIAGAVKLEANAARKDAGALNVTLNGSATGLQTGIAVADALFGGSLEIDGALQCEPAGVVVVDRLAATSAAAKLSGNGSFDPASRQLAAGITFDLPRLKPLGAALGADMTGAGSARVEARGVVERLRLNGTLTGHDIAAYGRRVDRLHLAVDVVDLSAPKAAVDGTFRAFGLDGGLTLAAEPGEGSELVIPRFRMRAADTAIDGSLRVGLDTGLVRGSISGRAPDLARWSLLAGTPLAGSLDLAAGFDSRNGQQLELTVTGTRLSGLGKVGVGRLALTARLADVWRKPSGTAQLSLTSARFAGAEFTNTTAKLDSLRSGRFVFQLDAKGRPLSLAAAGEGGFEPGRVELRLNRLTGSLGHDRIVLEQPLTLTQRGNDLGFTGLALMVGPGRITGSGGVRGEGLSLGLNITDLSIPSGAGLLGYRDVQGTLTMAATLGGTLAAPNGHLSVNLRGLGLAAAREPHPPSLGLAAEGDWNGRDISLSGRVTGLKGDAITFNGSVPVVLRRTPLGISVPPQGRLALQLQGSGRLDHLADLLPLGEDRVSGRFVADASIAGTITSPAASGRVTLSSGRYENFATGAVLTNIEAALVGDRDRFTLTSFAAGDGAAGNLKAKGSVVLNGAAGPIVDLAATLADFRLAARDEAVGTANGTVSVAGPLAAPKVTAQITVERGEINLPQSLPPNVVVLEVTRLDSKAGKAIPLAALHHPPALSATLDIEVDFPGRIFVRGHGLDSEWRGRLTITGTSAAPQIAGSLEEIRGNVDLLGRSFQMTRGSIIFDGSAKLDPAIDIVAEVSTADITAQVVISGVISAPKITLTSTPPLPQDEVLARVLFNRGVGQITAGEGLQMAEAAATLAGGGPRVLDRLRGGLGLDWFRFGRGPTRVASSILNRNPVNASPTHGAALSAGKYVAPGVSVGVTQGISPPTSKITVEIELRPHVTVQTELGQTGGNGIGLNYNYDY